MRLIDLEMYKWKWHHDIYVHTRAKPPYLSWFQYWLEDAAFVSVMPRQTGKTEMLITLAQHMEENGDDYRVICPNTRMMGMLSGRGLDTNKIELGSSFSSNKNPFLGQSYGGTNLLVDEFTHINKKNHLIHVLDFPWKTVTMIGSF